MTPGDANFALHKFLQHNFELRHEKIIEELGRVLAAAGSSDPSWDFAERAKFLAKLCDRDKLGLKRVKEVLTMPATTESTFFQRTLLFQNAAALVLLFLTSSTVLGTTMSTMTNSLYGVVDSYFELISVALRRHVRQLVESKGESLRKTDIVSMIQVFKPIVLLVREYLDRFPQAATTRYNLLEALLEELSSSVDEWAALIRKRSFHDGLPGNETERDRWAGYINLILQEKITKLKATISYLNSGVVAAPAPTRTNRGGSLVVGEGQLQMLISNFDPPGEQRAGGPRHDNDKANIRDIGVHPTSQEIGCEVLPYLPYNFIGAPHHLRDGSPEQLLDVHFRLLREELVEPLRTSITALRHALSTLHEPGNQLGRILRNGGGRFKPGADAAHLQVWGDGKLYFSDTVCDERRGLLMNVGFNKDQPMRAWEFQLQRLLNPGALVTIISSDGEQKVDVDLGLVRSRAEDVLRCLRNRQRPTVQIEPFDRGAIKHALMPSPHKVQALVEVMGVLYEAVAPFLSNLKSTTPAQLPFANLLALPTIPPKQPPIVQPPRYARLPSFSFDLSGLLKPRTGTDAPQELRLSTDEDDKDRARAVLKEHGIVDSSQADAVVDTLTREVGIIVGPPGTGKSYTGVALINALLKSEVKPILIVCVTNHALDTVLSKVLEQGLTKSLVRLGSRSADERVASYNLEALIKMKTRTRNRDMDRAWAEMKEDQREVLHCIDKIKSAEYHLPAHQLLSMASISHPVHITHIQDVPSSLKGAIEGWVRKDRPSIQGTFEFWRRGIDLDLRQAAERALKTQASGKKKAVPAVAKNRFEALSLPQADPVASANGHDGWRWPCDVVEEESDDEDDHTTHSLTEQVLIGNLEDDHDCSSVYDSEHSAEFKVPDEAAGSMEAWPTIRTRGHIEDLEPHEVWNYSRKDRELLIQTWLSAYREVALSELKDACRSFDVARSEVQQIRDNDRVSVMQQCDIIGATTNGAAKAADLLKSIKPKVLLVEEAGQVLEAHILATLSSSVEHLILIGDHNQLRPQISNYGLSLENKRGRGHLHRLDLSLMERLVDESLFPVSRIITQRRMRPEICDLVRFVQPLEDHSSTLNRPDVKGLGKNMFFFDHRHPESAQETSRTNEFEADMAVDMVRHLVNQGYTAPGDICIIVAYLSQMSKVKERLHKVQIDMLLSEKDAALLADEELKDEPADPDAQGHGVVVHQSLSTAVRVATVDNFQGEEARIIILSLVRNQGVDTDEELASARFMRKAGIGFLKSKNRAYVALSRAREGLYIFGNADLLRSHSSFWHTVITRLEEQDAVVNAIPLKCDRHPHVELGQASEPGQLSLISPQGGCDETCGQPRPCGHVCRAKCHPGDPDHLMVPCSEPCAKVKECGHPCKRRCGERCGPCDFKYAVVTLPCGHEARSVPCNKREAGTVWCSVIVPATVPECGHDVQVECSRAKDKVICNKVCDETMLCCGRACQSPCRKCTELNRVVKAPLKKKDDDAAAEEGEDEVEDGGAEARIERVERVKHVAHECGTERPCGHKCSETCTSQHRCSVKCMDTCNKRLCSHMRCDRACYEPCMACLAPCEWHCKHRKVGQCSNPCGVPCERPPCDEPCDQVLACGHPCPSVCGEPCDAQTCASCAPEHKLCQVVDFIMLSTLAELDVSSRDLDSRTITLVCGHVFTVDTLDKHWKLHDFYGRDAQGGWQRSGALPAELSRVADCPSCRRPATAMRYGRPYKCAFLDEQEKKLAVLGGQQVQKLLQQQKDFDLEQMRVQFSKPDASLNLGGPPRHKLGRKGRDKYLAGLARAKLPASTDEWANLVFFGFGRETAAAWNKAIQPVLAVTRQADKLLREDSPHSKAWQAAVSKASDLAIKSLHPNDPNRDLKALQLARRSVSMPEPRAQSKVHLQLALIVLELRLLLVDLAQAVASKVYTQDLPKWPHLIEILLRSGVADAGKTVAMAEEAQYGAEQLRAVAIYLRFDAELLRFKFKRSLDTPQAGKDRAALEERAVAELAVMRARWDEAARLTFAKEHEKQELDGQVKQVLEDVEKNIKFDEVAERKATRMMIVQALMKTNVDLQYDGHWYRCPNGHPFVIGDCGGAMQVSNCPECGAQIGGGGHQLLRDNTREDEMESFAREFGAQASPWAWNG